MMQETLLNAYTPLIFWTGLGLILFRFLPYSFPRLLGRSLYWVGVPLEILALSHQTDYASNPGLAPITTVLVLLVGFILVWICLKITHGFFSQSDLGNKLAQNDFQGSFVISSLLGNTGFVGLAIAPYLVQEQATSLVVFYSVTNNIIGTYGMGVLLASYFGKKSVNRWWIQLKDVVTVPSLWAFVVGYFTHNRVFPQLIESGLQDALLLVIPAALLLMGMRLSQIQGWQSFGLALFPALLKVVLLPALVGLGTWLLGVSGDYRLALVIMSGMPTAFAGLILAEEYDLERELIASSIVLSTLILLLMIPVWLVVI